MWLPSPQGRNWEADHTGSRRKAGTRAQMSLPLTGLTLRPPPGVQVPGLGVAGSRTQSRDLPRWPRGFWGPPGPSVQWEEEECPCGLRGKVSESCWGPGRVLTVLEALKAGKWKAWLHCHTPSSKPGLRQKCTHPRTQQNREHRPARCSWGRPHWGRWSGTQGALLRTQTSLRKHKLEQKSDGGRYWLSHLFLFPPPSPSPSLPPPLPVPPPPSLFPSFPPPSSPPHSDLHPQDALSSC